MADPTVAVVVPTYRRPDALERCLGALARQTVAPDRVVVVVRDDDRDTGDRLARAPLAVEVVSVREPGAIAAIVAGVARCAEDVVAHTDDDAVPHADWIERLLALYSDGVGGVGGRDAIERPGQRRTVGPVGRLTWFGRLHGNHHLGDGEPRDVDVLKGVSLSMRRELWRIDRALRGAGAQPHWEVGLCLHARRRGWRLIYEPAAVVDHTPAERFDEDARDAPSPGARAHAEWNYAYEVARHLPVWRVPIAAAYVIAVGTRRAPGPIAWISMQSRESPRLVASLVGARASGLLAGFRSRGGR